MSKVYDQIGREIEIEEVYGDCIEDIYVTKAYYVNDDIEVTEDTLNYLANAWPQEVYEIWVQSQVCRAEYAYEGDR